MNARWWVGSPDGVRWPAEIAAEIVAELRRARRARQPDYRRERWHIMSRDELRRRRALLRRARSGDRRAQQTLWRRYRAWVLPAAPRG